MVFSTIKQNGLSLDVDELQLPLQYTNDITLKFVKDPSYKDYSVIPYAGVTESKMLSSEKEIFNLQALPITTEGLFKIKNQIMNKDGYLVIAFDLTNDVETVHVGNAVYKIDPSIGGAAVLPEDTPEWQSLVRSFMDQYIELRINPQIQTLTDEAISQQTESARLQTNINTAIESCGKYTFENKELKFQQADGTFGEPILLEGQSTVFLDESAKNVELNTIHVAKLEKVNVQVVVDGKQINVLTDISNVMVKNKKDVEITLKDYLNGLPQITVNADSTSAKIVWDDDIC